MKSAIIYYSFSGNTKIVAYALREHLKEKSAVEITALKPLDESKNFFGQSIRAAKRVRAKLAPDDFNFSTFDLICFGTPVWAFGPAPAMNTLLDDCSGLQGKEAVLFTTYGSGAGNQRCLDYMQDILAKKGVKKFYRFSIQQFKVRQKDFISLQIRDKIK